MKLKTTLKHVYLPALLGIILLSVTFRIAALFANFDEETGFFDGKILINIASIIITAGCVFMFTYAFSGSKNQKLIADFSTPATYVPTGALTVAMMFFAVLTAIKSSKTDFSISSFMAIPGATFKLLLKYISSNMSSFILSLMAPLSVISIGYFILTACVLKRGSVARAFLGTANVLFLAFYTSYLYFDTSTLARNAPNKIIDQMAFLFAALFFLYEIRISLGREKWNLYMAFGFIAAALTAYSSIPSLIFYFSNQSVISNNIQENVLSFALFVFILSRITLAAFLKEDKESESITPMREYSRGRCEYIKEKEEAAKKAYMELYAELNGIENVTDDKSAEAIQMTFDDSINSPAGIGAEYAETELFIVQSYNEENVEENEELYDEAPQFIQETIFIPENNQANEYANDEAPTEKADRPKIQEPDDETERNI